MFFNCRAAGGILVVLAGAGASYFLLRKQCSFEKTSYFYKSSLDVNESVLDCQGSGRDYSVFLVVKDDSDNTQQDTLSFQVVDNKNEGKVKWGPGSKVGDTWTDWGISVYKNNNNGTYDGTLKTDIRVPKNGNIYNRRQHWTSLIIPCQKSNLQLKQANCSNGGGNILRSSNMKFEIQQGGVKITKNFDWKDGFQPKRIFCSR